ncbi:MAG TPA: class I SAM-dependent methyltransferase [Gammaproteobacteria bacterium]|nr:class I SAM-dependent methyltransferase [Gammaproteobacteria bacterium]
MNCRHCDHPLEHIFLDLGFAPPSNAYLTSTDLMTSESYFPLKLFVCDQCWLVQTEDYTRADELFNSDYAYFSSVSQSCLDHARRYVEQMCDRFDLDAQSYVIEIASNDGYLLKNFVAAGIPCLGIEPTAGTAATAEELGVPVIREFFGSNIAARLAEENKKADLILGNNVYAHVPDINDFTTGLKTILKPDGIVTLEFPHLLRLIEENQFDTVYHEHFSYLSLHTVNRIFKQAGLRIWDVERLSTHGGSLRVYGCHADDTRATTTAVQKLQSEEQNRGLQQLATYEMFQERADRVKNDFVYYLIKQKHAGKTVAGYGAAAKGNTLLNYAGIKPDLLPYVCDAAPSKQGKFLPGSHIPILPPLVLQERRPDVVLILPWNIAKEVIAQNAYVKEWGGTFVTAVPEIRIVS